MCTLLSTLLLREKEFPVAFALPVTRYFKVAGKL
jgi:hypothetical protein